MVKDIESQPITEGRDVRKTTLWSGRSTNAAFSFLSVNTFAAIIALNAFVGFLCVNCFFAVLSINSAFSVLSVNSAFAIGCSGEAFKICWGWPQEGLSSRRQGGRVPRGKVITMPSFVWDKGYCHHLRNMRGSGKGVSCHTHGSAVPLEVKNKNRNFVQAPRCSYILYRRWKLLVAKGFLARWNQLWSLRTLLSQLVS